MGHAVLIFIRGALIRGNQCMRSRQTLAVENLSQRRPMFDTMMKQECAVALTFVAIDRDMARQQHPACSTRLGLRSRPKTLSGKIWRLKMHLSGTLRMST
jgi:hypothetical protein